MISVSNHSNLNSKTVDVNRQSPPPSKIYGLYLSTLKPNTHLSFHETQSCGLKLNEESLFDGTEHGEQFTPQQK